MNMKPPHHRVAAGQRADIAGGHIIAVSITAIYAGILTLIIVALGINVTVHRVKLNVSLGDGGNPQMLRMIRLHGNAIEYLPLALVLMATYEINGGWNSALHVIGVALVAARLMQTWAMWSTDKPSLGRGTGQTLTWLSIAVLAALNLWQVAKL